ncbi:MAG: tetratricopeptide repeat protein [Opitutaceae bacterium]
MSKPRSNSKAAVPGAPDPGSAFSAALPHGRAFWQIAVLIALALIAYGPIWHAGFIWDDDSMLTANPMIRARDGLIQFWFTKNALDYWPVTSSTLWLEWRLWGLNPLGYHLTNLALHLAGVALLWSVLRRLRVPGAWLAALIFAVHPVNVESVTWIAERKNLLALLFYLISILWFLKAGIAEGPSDPAAGADPPAPCNRWYWLSLIAFILAMLSKGSVATLPLALAGIIAWRRRLALSDLLRLVPFLVVAGALAAVDVWFQRHGAPEVIRQAGFTERLLGAGGVIWFYLSKSIWPVHLMFVYPQWRILPESFLWWLPLLGVLGFTALLWGLARRERLRPRDGSAPGAPCEDWGRAALYAWGYFCLSLVPVLGLTDVYFMKFSLVADHYAHVALIGVAAWIGFAAHSLYQRSGPAARAGLAVLVAVAVCSMAGLSWRQNLMYRDSLVLYRTTLALNPDCWLAHNNLGLLLSAQPDHGPEARAEFEAAIRIKPDYADAHNNLGLELAKTPGRQSDAIAQYDRAIQIKPDYAAAHNNLANELAKLPGRMPEAVAHYEQAIRINPNFADAHNNLAAALARIPGRLPEAVAHYEQALQINPNYAEAHFNLGLALAQIPGRLPEALDQYEQALRIRPDFAAAHVNLADELAKLPGRLPEAVTHYEQALRTNPDDADVQNNLAVALAKIPGRMPEALAHFDAALRIDPNDADLQYNLANQLAKIPDRLPDAVAHYEQALRIRPDFAEAHYNIAVAYARSGRMDDAARHLERVLELDPSNRQARELLEQLRAMSR